MEFSRDSINNSLDTISLKEVSISASREAKVSFKLDIEEYKKLDINATEMKMAILYGRQEKNIHILNMI